MAKLNESETARLEVVLGVTGDNEKLIDDGIRKALQDLRGPKYAGTRSYLWRLLTKKAAAKIRQARKKVMQQHKTAHA